MSRPSFSLGDRVHFERHYDSGNTEQADGLLFTKDYAPGREPWALVTDEGYVKSFSEDTAVRVVRSDSAAENLAPVYVPTPEALAALCAMLKTELLETLHSFAGAELHERSLSDTR